MDRPNIAGIKDHLDRLPAVVIAQTDIGVEIYATNMTAQQRADQLEFTLEANACIRALIAYIEELERRLYLTPDGATRFTINGREYTTHEEAMLGATLRELGGVSADELLFCTPPGRRNSVQVDDAGLVGIESRMVFFTSPRFINGG